jgi:predicted Zn finger-like uncharacterized protein
MHIICPNCAASYQVSAAALGAAGRQVRCLRCRSIWLQQPQAEVPPLAVTPVAGDTVAAFQSELRNEAAPQAAAEAPPPAVEAAPAVSENGDPAGPSLDQLMGPGAGPPPAAKVTPEAEPAAALSEISIPAEDAPPVVPEPTDQRTQADPAANIESVAARRRERSNARRRISMRAGRTPALILVLVCAVAALIGWRGSIVRHAPQMASLYAAIGLSVNLRGLTFTEVKVSRDTHDGVPVLIVEGIIVSAAPKPVQVPRLRLAMRNEAGGEIYAWTAMPTREVLEPGETLPFRSRLASPPGDGRDVLVRFFTRLDAVAGLR